jgi:16S rRNA processing protein RimM
MADAAWPEDALEVGRIVDAWGLKGWFRVQPYAVEADALLASRVWHLGPADANMPSRASASARPVALAIREARQHGQGLVASALGIDDRDAAESLRGFRIFIGRSSFPALSTDEFYWADLVGLAVVNRQGEALGNVAGLIDNGPQSVLRVRPADAAAADDESQERLIPFVAAYVDGVDLAGRRITVDWGLDY